ncbi:winged helix-turn-helix domain-containing protein [Psychrosphaera ytuae]|uniref:Winged helix-turn-helix domain-containing protein n=1 Tax=Psychrosphaera ytuae TaxID=2820710 RepID=A0A975DDW8_9GAMM|nr:helix-turn-helix domain-containing protein [Psychrosphaera ytuae]QTH65108.1 winged helix-turn-helix domain-containing protein [Psychrosphaera ytuae]
MTTVYVTADWTFTPATLTLRYVSSEEEIVLDPKTARLLGYLLRCYPQVCTREDIYQELYGIENARADGTITAYVSKLRKLLETNVDAKGKYIKTIPKTGYQFVAPHKIDTTFLSKEYPHEPDKQSANNQKLSEASPLALRYDEQGDGPIGQLNHLPFGKSAVYLVVTLLLLLFIVVQLVYSSNNSQEHGNTTHISHELSNNDWRLIHAESGINHSVAISDDSLFLAYVSAQQNINRLFVKSVLAEQLNIVFESALEKIYSPAFSPNGQRIAFVTTGDKSCRLNVIELTLKSQLIPGSHQVLENCDLQQKKTPVSFLDDDNLLFIAKSDKFEYGALSMLNISTGEIREMESLVTSTAKADKFAVDYNFAVHRPNQQVALLKRLKNGSSGLYLIQLDEKEIHHIVTIDDSLTALEWLNTEKLIVMKQGQLQLIDLDKKDIRPVTFAQVKEVLKQSNS